MGGKWKIKVFFLLLPDYMDFGLEWTKPHARGVLKSSREEAAGVYEVVWSRIHLGEQRWTLCRLKTLDEPSAHCHTLPPENYAMKNSDF